MSLKIPAGDLAVGNPLRFTDAGSGQNWSVSGRSRVANNAIAFDGVVEVGPRDFVGQHVHITIKLSEGLAEVSRQPAA